VKDSEMTQAEFDLQVQKSANRLIHLGAQKWREAELNRIGKYPYSLDYTPESHKIILENQSGFWVACFDDWSGAEDDRCPIAFSPTQEEAIVELLFAANIDGELQFEVIVK
jgi:hypothetical protein